MWYRLCEMFGEICCLRDVNVCQNDITQHTVIGFQLLLMLPRVTGFGARVHRSPVREGEREPSTGPPPGQGGFIR